MKVAVIADLHLRGKDLDTTAAQLNAAVDIICKRDVDLVVFAGDIFDRPMIGDNYVATGGIAAVAMEAIITIPSAIIMIPGQHDFSGPTAASALNPFRPLGSVRVIDHVSLDIIDPPFEDFPALRILAIPWLWDGNAEELIGEQIINSKGKIDLVIGHVQVVGGKMASGFVCPEKPGQWQISRTYLESIPARHFALGDFHRRQDLTDGRGGYVGALRQLSFSDEGNPAGFEIWDSETDKTEWIELDEAPRYRTIIAVPGMTLPEPNPNEIIRVRYEAGYNPDPVDIAKLEGAGIRVETVVEAVERVQRAHVPIGIVDQPRQLIRLWAEVQNPPIGGVEIDALVSLFDRVMGDRKAITT